MPLSLIMDILIIVLLAATIFYAVKLSRHLEVFRSNRSDMERLIRDLSMQITRAQEGISTLDDVAKESSKELRKLVDRAVGLSDELQIINESSDKLAERLESLGSKNREIADHMSQTSVRLTYPGATRAPAIKTERASEPEVPSSALFSIRDPDFKDDDEEEGLSQSEKNLAAALRRKGKGDF